MPRVKQIDQNSLPQKEPSVFKKLESGFGARLTPNDIIVLLNTPISFINQLLASYAREVWAAKLLQEEILLLNNLRFAEEEYYSYLYAQLMRAASLVNLNEIGLTEDDIIAEQKAINDVLEMQAALNKLTADLNNEKSVVDSLLKDRDSYLAYLPKAWDEQQLHQVHSLINTLNTCIHQFGIPPLIKSDIEYLSKTPKPQKIMLEKPHIISTEASVNTIMDKGNNTLNMNLLRLLASKQHNVDHPDEVLILKPQMTKKIDRWVNSQLGPNYWNNIKEEDAKLMLIQQNVLEDINNKIKEHQLNIASIGQKISQIENRFDSLKMNTPHLDFRDEDTIANDKRITERLTVSSSPAFFQNLEMLYDDLSQSDRTFELKLFNIVKALSEEEKIRFWKNCEKHAEYASNVSDKERNLFKMLMEMKEEPRLKAHH